MANHIHIHIGKVRDSRSSDGLVLEKKIGNWSLESNDGKAPFVIKYKGRVMELGIRNLASAERKLEDFVRRYGQNATYNSVGGLVAGN